MMEAVELEMISWILVAQISGALAAAAEASPCHAPRPIPLDYPYSMTEDHPLFQLSRNEIGFIACLCGIE